MHAPDDILAQRYRIVRELGRGGYGFVYLAEELSDVDLLGRATEPLVLRHVALKILRTDKKWSKRFAGEVRALCRLNHPHIVTVYGYDRAPVPYVAMEYVAGAPLSEHMGAPARAAYQTTIRWLIGVAEALSHAHARGVVHRDLKPHNILITEDGWPKVVDFGLSWLLEPDQDLSQKVGTPGYLAPELIDGDEKTADHRVDIYGLGATLFAAFAGASPFSSNTLLGTVHKQMAGTFAFPDDFPPALRPIVERCLAPDPIDRPRTAAAVAEELRRIALAPAALRAGNERAGTLSEWSTLPDRVDLRDARLERLESFDHPSRGRGVKFQLVTTSDPSVPTTGGFSYAGTPDTTPRRVHEVLEAAWPGAELSLYGARVVQNAAGGRFLAVDGSTVPVLEPYHPVSVTDVARVEGVRAGTCATRALVELRTGARPGKHLVLGALAHDTLEALMAPDAPADLDAAFDRAVQRLRWQALAAGLDDDALESMRTDLDLHFGHLASWTENELGVTRAAEATRYSSRYGLEGRIDLARIDDDTMRILELKTGSFESPEHVRQLRCYLLMWDALADATGRRVEGELLYSKKGKRKPVQRRSHENERDVVLARNHVIAMRRWFSDGDTAYRPPSCGDDPRLCDDAPCRFRRDECARQTKLLGTMSGADLDAAAVDREVWGDADETLVRVTRRYYFHWTRLIEREYRAASADMGAAFRDAGVEERIAALDALTGLTLSAVDGKAQTLTLEGHNPGVFHAGDAVLLHRGDIDEHPSASGKVQRADRSSVVVSCESTTLLEGARSDGWTLDRHQLRIGFRDLHRALFGFVSSGDLRRIERLVLPHRAGVGGQRSIAGIPTAEPDAAALGGAAGDRMLNASQQRAIQTALEGHDALLVHGPPGTGKTTVIAELAARLVARGDRVLLAACTNTAVDTMLARVVRAGVVDVLRVSSSSRATNELRDALSDAGREPGAHFTGDLERRTPRLETLSHRLRDTAVFAATANACVSSPVFGALARALDADASTTIDASDPAPPFDVVIVDEASQLTEPLALGPIALARRFVLVGDDKQLPPVVRAADAQSAQLTDLDTALDEAGVRGLDRSLFERLRPYVPSVLLQEQYRMNEGVQAFPNQCYYDGQLRAAPGVGERKLALEPADVEGLDEELTRRLDPARPSVWVDVGGEDDGRTHAAEAAEIVRTAATLAERLHRRDVLREDSIGVVAPYRAQCNAIRSGLAAALGDELARLIEVDTVERFQGREKDAILVSLVCREWNDFVMDPRRLNVTLTRARTKVVVFGAKALGRRMLEGA